MPPRRLLPRRQIKPPQGKNDETGKVIHDCVGRASAVIHAFVGGGGTKRSCKERCAKSKGSFLEGGDFGNSAQFGC